MFAWPQPVAVSVNHGVADRLGHGQLDGARVNDAQALGERCDRAARTPTCAGVAGNSKRNGALTHYGWSLHDALATFEGPVVELHLSNPNAREPWRHTSVVAPVATGTIMGFGGHGYVLAVEAVARLLS